MTGARASRRYAEENIVKVIVGINRRTEPELVEKVESVENRSGYVKDLIRADIASRPAQKKENSSGGTTREVFKQEGNVTTGGKESSGRELKGEERMYPEPDEVGEYVRMNLLVTKEQKRSLKIRAAVTGESVSSWVRAVIDEFKALGDEGMRGFEPIEGVEYVRMNVLVTKEQRRFLKLQAAVTGESVSSWVRAVIDSKASQE